MNPRSAVARHPGDVLKVVVIVACWVLLAATLVSHFGGRLSPYLQAGVGIVVLSLAAYAVWAPSRPSFPAIRPLLAAIVALGVYYRASIVSFPSSYLGMDPDKFATVMVSLMETGRVAGLDFQFYGKAPTFLLSGALTGKILGVGDLRILDVYAYVFGIFFPLLAYVIARRLWTDRAGIYAALLVTVGATSVMYAVMPLAQTLAVGLWLPFLYVLGQYLQHKRGRDLALAFLFAVTLVYTHKITTLLVFGAVVGSGALILLKSGDWRDRPVRRATTPSTLFVLTLLSGVLVLVQLTVITDFITGVIGRLLLALQVASVTTVHAVPKAARPVAAGPLYFLLRRAYGLSLVPLAGIAWLLLARKAESDDEWTLLAGIAVCIVLTGVGSVSVSAVNPSRMYFYVELLLCVLVSITLLTRYATGRRRRTLAAAVLVLLLMSQLVSPLVVPDSPQSDRQYLTAEEVAAKRFSSHVPAQIATDQYYAQETVNLRNPGDQRVYVAADENLMNDTAFPDRDYVAYREKARVYRLYGKMKGRWSLTYDPEVGLDRHRDRVYANGGVVIYD